MPGQITQPFYHMSTQNMSDVPLWNSWNHFKDNFLTVAILRRVNCLLQLLRVTPQSLKAQGVLQLYLQEPKYSPASAVTPAAGSAPNAIPPWHRWGIKPQGPYVFLCSPHSDVPTVKWSPLNKTQNLLFSPIEISALQQSCIFVLCIR